MLSIGLVRRSSDAVRYYEKDDYYTKERDEKAEPESSQLELDAAEKTSRDGFESPERDGSSAGVEMSLAAGGGSSNGAVEGLPSGGGSGAGTDEAQAPRGLDTGAGAGPESSSNGESQGTWHGEAARALGLEGAVTKTDFQAVLDGRLPNGIALGRRFEGEWQHTPGWDLTFSAPKSVSILAEVAQDSRLHEAHQRAVDEALEWTEKNAIGARVPSPAGTVFVRTESMLVAQFTHHTSRNQDPNLHTHSVVANVTQTSEGQWRSVHSRELFNNKMAIGQIYRSALAREVLALGYEIEQTHRDGRFEIVGVPGELVRAMSTRREQVESKLAQWGAQDPETAARAALVTRPHKQDTPLSHLIAQWRTATAGRGFDVDALVAEAKARGPQQLPARTKMDAILREAVLKLAEPEAVFRHGDLVREVLQREVGRIDVRQAEEAIARSRTGLPLRAADEGGVRLWTTTRAHTQEQRALEIAAGVDRAARPHLTSEQANAILADKQLTEGQRLAVATILTTESPHMGVLGRPGTGKTTMLRTVRQQLGRQGLHVVGLAQNANAARTLEKEAGIESSTIHKHLRRIAPQLARASRTSALDKLMTELTRREEVWVIDESSQLPNNLLSRLLAAADKIGARTVFVGDTRQLSAIEAGKPFELLLDRGMPYVEMDQILRQRSPHDVAMVGDAIAGRVSATLEKLADRTSAVQDTDSRIAAVVAHWARDEEKRGSTVVLTLTNAERLELNERMRDVLRREGALRDEVSRTTLEKMWGARMDTRDAAFYQVAHVVQFTADNAAIDAKGGSYWNVDAVDAKRNTVILSNTQDGRTVTWNPREDGAREKFPVVVYQRRDTTLATGETVRWARNYEHLGLTNGDLLTVDAVKPDSTIFRTSEGRTVEVSHSTETGQHWTHAYASTVYSAQGRTAEHAILHLNSQSGRLLSQHAFVVAVSRHRDTLHLYTDSKERLQRTLEHQIGDKTSAVEAVERNRDVDAALRLERELAKQRESERSVREAVEKSRGRSDADRASTPARKEEKDRSASAPRNSSKSRGEERAARPRPELER